MKKIILILLFVCSGSVVITGSAKAQDWNLQGYTDVDTLATRADTTSLKDSVKTVNLRFTSKWNYLWIKNTSGDSTDRFEVYNVVDSVSGIKSRISVRNMDDYADYTEFSVPAGQERKFLLLDQAIGQLLIRRKTTYMLNNKDLFSVIKVKD